MFHLRISQRFTSSRPLTIISSARKYGGYSFSIDTAVQNPTGLENNKIMAKQVDTIAMLGHVNTQLARLRRDEIKPSLKAEYTAICSAEVPITSQ